MNEQEQNDVDFLMNVPPEVLADWYSKMPKEEIEYAMDLLRRAFEEGAQKLDAVMDVTEAKEMLDKFRL